MEPLTDHVVDRQDDVTQSAFFNFDWGVMASEVKLFMEAIHKATGKIPVWYPGTDISLGDIGVFEDGQWVLKTTLEDQEIPYRIRKDTTPSAGLDLGHGSKWSGGLDVETKVAGIPGAPEADGSLKLSLAGSGSFVLKSSDSFVHRIKNLDEVEGEMISRWRADDGSWAEEWCVVSEVYEASRSFVAVASDREASMSFDLGVKPAGAFLDLASVGVGARVSTATYVSGHSLQTSPTPLTFSVRRVHRDRATGRQYIDTPVVVRDADVDGDMNWKE